MVEPGKQGSLDEDEGMQAPDHQGLMGQLSDDTENWEPLQLKSSPPLAL